MQRPSPPPPGINHRTVLFSCSFTRHILTADRVHVCAYECVGCSSSMSLVQQLGWWWCDKVVKAGGVKKAARSQEAQTQAQAQTNAQAQAQTQAEKQGQSPASNANAHASARPAGDQAGARGNKVVAGHQTRNQHFTGTYFTGTATNDLCTDLGKEKRVDTMSNKNQYQVHLYTFAQS